MATLRVTAEKLTVLPHPNADALELAQVGLYRAVVAKGAYQTGDYALYIPEQAILPTELIEEFGLTGRLAGSKSNRVKAIWLRGELSQGIVCRTVSLRDIDLATAHAENKDFSGHLGITKWIPQVPVHMSGTVISAPDLMRWVNIENIERYPEVFEPGEKVAVTEKVHGSCCLLTLIVESGDILVTSKGLGEQRLSLLEDENNLYWRAAHEWAVPEAARELAELLGANRIGIFGEVYGAGVQDLSYGAVANKLGERPGYAVFDIAVDIAGERRWLDQDELVDLVGKLSQPLPLVPRLYTGPYDEQKMLQLAEGTEEISGSQEHLREGVVIRALPERHSEVLAGRAILKAVSDAYLTRQGGTEYE